MGDKEGVFYWKRESEETGSIHLPKHKLKIMVWGGVRATGKTKLYFLNENVTAKSYQKILNECLDEKNTENNRVLQDNASAHKAHTTLDWFDSKGIELIDLYPANSSDLNEIEFVWSWMKHDVNKQNPETTEKLKEAIQTSWDRLPQGTIKKYISHVQTVCNKIVETKGDN